jgi:hypothetical protein
MNTSVDKVEKEHFSVEDIVSYSNIEITHVNDNKAPVRIIATKVAIWIVIASLVAAMFLT